MKKVKHLRHLRALTLRELGQEAGISYATIWRIESGYSDVRPSTIRKLARAFGIDTAELVATAEDRDA